MSCRLMVRLILALAGLTALTPAKADVQWGMNDATLIYPLPYYPQEISQLISPQSTGPGGPLLPLKYFLKLPAINQGEAKLITYQNLRVVAVRFDPCFSFRGECLPQVRLVWQPINKSAYGSSTRLGLLEAKDAAIHSLHTLDAASFEALLGEYDGLRRNRGWDISNEPLQIHPVMSKQGLQGPFAKAFKALLEKYLGEKNLWRLTAMSTFVGSDQWAFQGFNIKEGAAQEIAIPRTQGATRQQFAVSSLTLSDYSNGQISPAPMGIDNLSPLLRNSRLLSATDPAMLKELGTSVARIENPNVHTPETLDCVSCHTANAAGSVLFNRFSWLKNDPKHIQESFRSSRPLQDVGLQQGSTQILRALGYFERQLVLSRRVINETAKVVERLNKSQS
jgi:hypothetical protein